MSVVVFVIVLVVVMVIMIVISVGNSGLGQLVEHVGEGGELGLHLLLGVVVGLVRVPAWDT